MNLKRLAAVFLAPAAFLSLTACGINSIPTAEEEAKARWADVENQYQRRADLIPNLVATVQGYADQEREVLTEVTEARANAGRVQLSAADLDDPEKVRAFNEAQNRLTAAIIPLQRLQEAYPDLKSNQNFLTLQSQIEGTENSILVSRRDYNEAVQNYNTTIRTFPAVIGAKIFYGAEPMVPFEATTEDAEEAPTVSFGNSQ